MFVLRVGEGIEDEVGYRVLGVGCNGVGCVFMFLFLMIRQPPRSTGSSSSAESDGYKRQVEALSECLARGVKTYQAGHLQHRNHEAVVLAK